MLRAMAPVSGPAAFIHLSSPAGGDSGFERHGSITPSPKGFTFATWLRLDDAHTPTTASDGATLFACLSSDPAKRTTSAQPPRGFVLLVRNACIHVETFDGARGGSGQLLGGYRLRGAVWHHVVVTHAVTSKLPLGSVSTCVYVDGVCVDRESTLRVPRVERAYEYVAVGAAMAAPSDESARPFEALRGQLGSVYLFEDAITATQVRRPESCLP